MKLVNLNGDLLTIPSCKYQVCGNQKQQDKSRLLQGNASENVQA
jgi:hypothetical protein